MTGIVAVELAVEKAMTSASRMPRSASSGRTQEKKRIRSRYHVACSASASSTATMNAPIALNGPKPSVPTTLATIANTPIGTS